MTGSESERSTVTSVIRFFLLTFAFSWMILEARFHCKRRSSPRYFTLRWPWWSYWCGGRERWLETGVGDGRLIYRTLSVTFELECDTSSLWLF